MFVTKFAVIFLVDFMKAIVIFYEQKSNTFNAFPSIYLYLPIYLFLLFYIPSNFFEAVGDHQILQNKATRERYANATAQLESYYFDKAAIGYKDWKVGFHELPLVNI